MTFLARATCLLFAFLLAGCVTQRRGRDHESARSGPAEQLAPPADLPAPVDGIAAAILVDTSGSMKEAVSDVSGAPVAKIVVARRSVLAVLGQFEEFARRNPEKKLLVGVYEFSSRDDPDWCREVIPPGPPDAAAAADAVSRLRPLGGTPIGEAMIRAKLALDQTGLRRKHLLVVTDGESNRGYAPGDVARAIGRLPDDIRAMIHFIAFDVEAARFRAVQDAGGLVLEAASERDLRQTLDFVLTGRILAEEPAGASRR